MSVSKTILIGRLGKDPEINTTQQGKLFAKFSVATSESYKDKRSGERKDHTDWHNIVVFVEPLAEFAEKYLKKGNLVYLEGQNKTRQWKDSNGSKHYSTDVVLNGFNAVLTKLEKSEGRGTPDLDDYGTTTTRKGSSSQDYPAGRPQAGGGEGVHDDDDIPFAPEWRI